jgi:hypothetical protein
MVLKPAIPAALRDGIQRPLRHSFPNIAILDMTSVPPDNHSAERLSAAPSRSPLPA